MKTLFSAAASAAMLLALSGCDDRDREVRTVHVSRGHVCDVNCHEHYEHEGRVVVVERHRHGPGCGHEWDGRRWVIVRTSTRRPVRTAHVCTLNCHHHYYSGTKIVQLPASHRHTAGCGHAYDGNRWVRAAQPTRVRRR